jgi:hypothetical protein
VGTVGVLVTVVTDVTLPPTPLVAGNETKVGVWTPILPPIEGRMNTLFASSGIVATFSQKSDHSVPRR